MSEISATASVDHAGLLLVPEFLRNELAVVDLASRAHASLPEAYKRSPWTPATAASDVSVASSGWSPDKSWSPVFVPDKFERFVISVLVMFAASDAVNTGSVSEYSGGVAKSHALKIGSVSTNVGILAQDASEPFVVKNLPLFPV
jgi:hypothetical protein